MPGQAFGEHDHGVLLGCGYEHCRAIATTYQLHATDCFIHQAVGGAAQRVAEVARVITASGAICQQSIQYLSVEFLLFARYLSPRKDTIEEPLPLRSAGTQMRDGDITAAYEVFEIIDRVGQEIGPVHDP